MKYEEPRFLLDEESICYGCKYYRHFLDVDDIEKICDDNIDENEGMCDCNEICYFGSLNDCKGEKMPKIITNKTEILKTEEIISFTKDELINMLNGYEIEITKESNIDNYKSNKIIYKLEKDDKNE